MYSNIGRKIKVLAKVIGWISLIAGVIAWLVLITNNSSYRGKVYYITGDDWIGWMALVVGIMGIVASWPLYGFGELIELAGEIEQNTRKNGVVVPQNQNVQNTVKTTGSQYIVCKQCGTEQGASRTVCYECGALLKKTESNNANSKDTIPTWKRVEMEKQNQENQ